METVVVITREGYLRLIEKLIYLSQVVRPRLLEEVQEARIHAHRRDNGEYVEVMQRLNQLQRTMDNIEDTIGKTEILVGCKSYCKHAYLGATITLKNNETGDLTTYTLVGAHESDIPNGRLSTDSPLGTALIGHREGDHVMVETPSGIKSYAIVSVEW